MKILSIIGHPNLSDSRLSAEFIKQLPKFDVTVRLLEKQHINYIFNVEEEQNELICYDRIVFIFPMFWYSMPALMKKWIDDVFLPGFAYARHGDKLASKEIQVVTTVGAPKEGYRAGGFNNYTIDDLLKPIQQTANYVKAKYLPSIAIYESVFLSENTIQKIVADVCCKISSDQDSPDLLYEKLLLRAESEKINLISND
ncbi:NAD(P)H-dependent oxidoreductase [Xenorhabdus bovienii]|uniref:NAD(P)H-dependent oxidoreductase n=1 Tax=Xenorhabdus bovienii TaxID=40576 RepID=UPI0023B23A8C|nr:NAD(P)H-dependent oxidoreductase [Xenorhabdus bovienii]MDE9453692.1 NAD(P)H-dependent oxidoreductase [Xenorhabdus bovienii]